MNVANLSAMAAMLLGHGGWPLHEAEAAGVIERFFIGKCGTPQEKRKLMARLGVVTESFPVCVAREHATLHARAALAELQSLDLIESKEVGPGAARDERWVSLTDSPPKGRYLIYKKTEAGRKALAELATHGWLSAALRDEGWPS